MSKTDEGNRDIGILLNKRDASHHTARMLIREAKSMVTRGDSKYLLLPILTSLTCKCDSGPLRGSLLVRHRLKDICR
jgi:hypothetical protein